MSVKRIGRFKIKDNIAELRKFKGNAPLILGNVAVNWFKKGFDKGGYQTDASANGWAARKSSALRNAGRKILIDSGKLKQSIKIRSRKFSRIMIGTSGLKYAKRHNNGLKGMPKRELMGDSKRLEKKLKRKIEQLIKLT